MGGPVLRGVPDIICVLPVAGPVHGKLLRPPDRQLVAEHLPLQQGSSGAYPLLADTVLVCQRQNPAEPVAVKILLPRLSVQEVGIIHSMAEKGQNKITSVVSPVKIIDRLQPGPVLDAL